MLEQYFVKPGTVDRVRASWIGSDIESYVAWMAERRYGAKTIWRRVPIMVAFGEFARARGALVAGDLPDHVDAS
jgi:integrase/recombinase XerD